MPASSKPTAVHFWLIVFVILTLIVGVLWYVTYRDYTETAAQLDEAQQQAGELKTVVDNRHDQLQRLKEVIGHEFEDVGLDQEDNPNTVLGAMHQDIQQHGGSLAQPTYSATIVKLHEELSSRTKTNNDLQAELRDHKDRILALQNQYQAMVDQHAQARRQAEADLQERITNQEEALAVKDQTISELRSLKNQLQRELDQEREAHAKVLSEKNQQLAEYRQINEHLRQQLDEVTQPSFEVADGFIRQIDNINRLVWINLGSADNLRQRVTFSVYAKNHQGVGGDPEDIKGSIEVTRIIGPHLAEARILKPVDIYRPMTPGDPVYTPLWSPGQKERFSIVGLIDFDDNGISDRAQLHEMIQTAGAVIDNEVDPQGNLTGDGITVHTKFLVVGEIPDYTQSPPDKREAHENITQMFDQLRDQALRKGVRIVRLNDFLAYIGYKPSQRLWRPGESSRYTLEYGSRKTGVDDVRSGASATSTGNVSGLFNRNPRLNRPRSTGQSSGSSRGTRGY